MKEMCRVRYGGHIQGSCAHHSPSAPPATTWKLSEFHCLRFFMEFSYAGLIDKIFGHWQLMNSISISSLLLRALGRVESSNLLITGWYFGAAASILKLLSPPPPSHPSHSHQISKFQRFQELCTREQDEGAKIKDIFYTALRHKELK